MVSVLCLRSRSALVDLSFSLCSSSATNCFWRSQACQIAQKVKNPISHVHRMDMPNSGGCIWRACGLHYQGIGDCQANYRMRCYCRNYWRRPVLRIDAVCHDCEPSPRGLGGACGRYPRCHHILAHRRRPPNHLHHFGCAALDDRHLRKGEWSFTHTHLVSSDDTDLRTGPTRAPRPAPRSAATRSEQ